MYMHSQLSTAEFNLDYVSEEGFDAKACIGKFPPKSVIETWTTGEIFLKYNWAGGDLPN